jgi:uncharacterized protein (DUF2147 family)
LRRELWSFLFILKESFMRSLLALTFLLFAGSAGHTQSFSFNVGGQPIHIDVRGHCADCISVVVPGYVQYGRPRSIDNDVPYVGRSHRSPRNAQVQKRKPQVAMLRESLPPSASGNRNSVTPATQPPSAQLPANPVPAVAAVSPIDPPAAPAPAAPPPAASRSIAATPSASAVAAVAPEATVTPPAPATPAPAIPGESVAAPVAPPPASPPVAVKKPTVIAALPPAKEIEHPARPSAPAPVGVWSSSEGQMRVEQCGKNICSYAVGGPHAGKMILRNMRQTSDNRWAGQVTDVRSGQTYSAHMSMRGPNSLNIQGCALGGLVCGGRTMTRVH